MTYNNSTLTSFSANAFEGCTFENGFCHIGSKKVSQVHIGENTLKGCTDIKTIYFDGSVITYDDNVSPDLKFKVIVVDNMSVGKSCLALRATEGMFKENLGSAVPLSICNFNVKINDKKISLQIWDTCGQEKYRALIKGYHTNSSLAIIVYSVTDKDSFDDINV